MITVAYCGIAMAVVGCLVGGGVRAGDRMVALPTDVWVP